MDARLFRLPTEPSLNPPGLSFSQAKEVTLSRLPSGTKPATDSRYPGWAGPMADGRLVTDYRTHCAENIPAGQQFAVHQWMQRNTDDIIQVSRQRQAMNAGATQGFDLSVVAPPIGFVQCDTMECSIAPGSKYGIGVERREPTPVLFGTFDLQRQERVQSVPSITQRYEGGRNSVRGTSYTNLGTHGVANVNLVGTYGV